VAVQKLHLSLLHQEGVVKGSYTFSLRETTPGDGGGRATQEAKAEGGDEGVI